MTRALKSRSAIEVSLDDGTATLRGEVDSAAAKDQAGLVAQFEPGVESVQNLLTVRGRSEPPFPAKSP
ncbi:MAG: BON domain-containing protein [Planctomycetaceae bacterium]